MSEVKKIVSSHRQENPKWLASAQRARTFVKPTPERPLLISASELGSFLRCRVQHHWRYQLRLEHPHKNLPQSIGTLGHMVLDEWYQLSQPKRTQKAMQTVAQRVINEARALPESKMALEEKDRELIEAMCVGYAGWTLNPATEYSDAQLQMQNCVPEEWFDLPLTKDGSIRVRGKLDMRFFPGVYKKTVAIIETKFKGAIRYDPVENRLQLSVYLWALRQKFPKMERFIAYPQIIRKQLPGPRVKADLFWRDMVERDMDEVDQWAIDTRNIARDLIDGAVYPSPMDSCSWMCDFKIPCQLRGSKADLLHVLKNEFTRREEST